MLARRSRPTSSCWPPATCRGTRSSRSSTPRSRRASGTIVVTHPDSPRSASARSTSSALAERGALLERAFTTPYTGKGAWERVFAATRAVGAREHGAGTDLGQVFNPPVEDGLAIMADRFLAAGFTERRSADHGRREHASAGGGRVSRRVQVIGAHSADFVWRAGGAIAKARPPAAAPRSSRCPTASAASPASCGRRRARRSRTSSGSGTPRPRRRRRTRRHVPLPGPGRLPAADRRRGAAGDRRGDPRVRARRPHHAHRHRPVQPRPPGGLRRGRPRARRWPPAPASRARSPPISRRSCSCSSRISPSCATSRRPCTSTSPRCSSGRSRRWRRCAPSSTCRPTTRSAPTSAATTRAARPARPRCGTPRRSSASCRRWWSGL